MTLCFKLQILVQVRWEAKSCFTTRRSREGAVLSLKTSMLGPLMVLNWLPDYLSLCVKSPDGMATYPNDRAHPVSSESLQPSAALRG